MSLYAGRPAKLAYPNFIVNYNCYKQYIYIFTSYFGQETMREPFGLRV